MSSEIMQETTPLVECSAFHRGMSVLEASLRNTEDSDAIISCLLKGAAEFYAKQISSPTGKAKWTRAAVDHLLSNGKYIAVIGMEKFMDAQFEKSARCNVDYDKEGTPRKGTRYVSPAVIQI